MKYFLIGSVSLASVCLYGRTSGRKASVFVQSLFSSMQSAGTIVLMLAICNTSCSKTPEPAENSSQRNRVVSSQVREQLLEGAISVLGRLDDFDESAAYTQVFDRINQWSHAGEVAPQWKVDPLVESLPESLQTFVSQEAIGLTTFDATTDVVTLRDQRWLADIASTVPGDAIEELDVAKRLFEWTVRSLAIDTDPPFQSSPTNPGSRWYLQGEIVLSGRASPAQRAWIFLELLRHAGLSGVMLATPSSDRQGLSKPWIPALISGGEAYLFDSAYGMPIPGPLGHGIATAREAFQDPAILQQLDLSDRPYSVTALELSSVKALVCATPASLSRRMAAIDANLAGGMGIDLAIDASFVANTAVASLPGEQTPDRGGLWLFPFEVLRNRLERGELIANTVASELAVMTLGFSDASRGGRPSRSGTQKTIRPLFAARVREFRGDLDGPAGAKSAYLLARPSEEMIRNFAQRVPPQQAEIFSRLYERMKQDATYRLGILTLKEKQFDAAIDYLERMTLQSTPDGPWNDPARLALAQAMEATGRIQKAIQLLESDESPQRFGSRVEAARLRKIPNIEPKVSDSSPSALPKGT